MIEQARSGTSFRAWLPALALVVVPLAPLLCATAPARGKVAAVFPPWWDRGAVLMAASSAGMVVRVGGAGSVVVIDPGTQDGRGKLWEAGALLVLDPDVATGCLGSA